MSEFSTKLQWHVRQASLRRDQEVKALLAEGKGPSEIGRILGVTRQRAQQIIKRCDPPFMKLKRKRNQRKRGGR